MRKYEALPKALTQEVRRSMMRRVAAELKRPDAATARVKRT